MATRERRCSKLPIKVSANVTGFIDEIHDYVLYDGNTQKTVGDLWSVRNGIYTTEIVTAIVRIYSGYTFGVLVARGHPLVTLTGKPEGYRGRSSYTYTKTPIFKYSEDWLDELDRDLKYIRACGLYLCNGNL